MLTIILADASSDATFFAAKQFLHLNRIASGMVNVQFLLDGGCFGGNGQNIVSLIQIDLSLKIAL